MPHTQYLTADKGSDVPTLQLSLPELAGDWCCTYIKVLYPSIARQFLPPSNSPGWSSELCKLSC